MGLKAQLRTDSIGNLTIHMEGSLNYENIMSFRDELETIRKENPVSTLTLDMYSLDFVGSSGINHFVDTIKYFNDNGATLRLSNVKSEFMKVFKLYDFDAMDILYHEFDDDITEDLGPRFTGRPNTFEN
jgi:anti-sigma B factor antagonist